MTNTQRLNGLTATEAKQRQQQYGKNELKPPNQTPQMAQLLKLILGIARPLQTDTAKASIDRPTASSSNSISPMFFLPSFRIK